MKYRKKPIVIEAIQFTGHNVQEIHKFSGQTNDIKITSAKRIIIPTLKGEMVAMIGDWIIKGIKGEYYPCKPDIFEKSYEREEESR